MELKAEEPAHVNGQFKLNRIASPDSLYHYVLQAKNIGGHL